MQILIIFVLALLDTSLCINPATFVVQHGPTKRKIEKICLLCFCNTLKMKDHYNIWAATLPPPRPPTYTMIVWFIWLENSQKNLHVAWSLLSATQKFHSTIKSNYMAIFLAGQTSRLQFCSLCRKRLTRQGKNGCV